MQGSLFDGPQTIDLGHAKLRFWPQAIANPENYWQALERLAFRQDYLTIAGKTLATPRLQAFYQCQQKSYHYSGLTLQGKPFEPVLKRLLSIVQQLTGEQFNAILANYYRDGQDSMGFHADDEPELGPNPMIASLSFGGEREFFIRDKQSQEVFTLLLPQGSLLLMQAPMQRFYEHSIKKCPRAYARINLTFRQIIL